MNLHPPSAFRLVTLFLLTGLGTLPAVTDQPVFNTWTAATDFSWQEDDNWSTGAHPASPEVVAVFDGTSNTMADPTHGQTRIGFTMPVPTGPVHVTVYYKEGDFAAWPANHGIWSWGNEILVGFQVARHADSGSHTWDSSTSRHKFGRSLDGGLTWSLEDAFEAGITASATGHPLGAAAVTPGPSPGGIDFSHPDFAFTFRRATNTSGPSCFYTSHDRGKSWSGPFAFPNLDTAGVATRTEYFVEGPHRMIAFITTARSGGGIGWAAAVRTHDGAGSWERISWIGPEPTEQAIMPAAVRLGPNRILAVLRRTEGTGRWLAAYLSEDDGASWTWLNDPAEGLGWNSNPPALVRLADGRICLMYGVRGGATASGPPSRMAARFSADGGTSWGPEVTLRGNDGAIRDMGYPRAVQRPDGKVVMVYYYNHAMQDDPYRYIAATIFDPAIVDPDF